MARARQLAILAALALCLPAALARRKDPSTADACPDPNCADCNGSGKCKQCAQGFYKDAANSTACLPCGLPYCAGCDACKGPDCTDGRKCTLPCTDPSCMWCSEDPDVCTACDPNSDNWLLADGKCTQRLGPNGQPMRPVGSGGPCGLNLYNNALTSFIGCEACDFGAYGPCYDCVPCLMSQYPNRCKSDATHSGRMCAACIDGYRINYSTGYCVRSC